MRLRRTPLHRKESTWRASGEMCGSALREETATQRRSASQHTLPRHQFLQALVATAPIALLLRFYMYATICLTYLMEKRCDVPAYLCAQSEQSME